MRSHREVVRSRGKSFDDLVEQVADAMAALGHPSRHAGPRRQPADPAVLRAVIVNLAVYCEQLETALRGGSGLAGDRSPAPAGFLAVYAAARRLVILFRLAEESGELSGRGAAETFGDVDNTEEFLLRLDDPEGIMEATRSLVTTSAVFRELLPPAVRDGVAELERLLPAAG